MINVEKSIKLKAALDTLRPLKKADELRIMQKFRLDWNYHSNNLEGNSLTYGETKALILFGITAQGKPLKDHFEITGHDEAVKWVTEIIHQERALTENFIRELHKLILKESYEVKAITPDGQPTKRKVNVGIYKTVPNHVKTKTGEIFRFATPEETPAMMHDLVAWYRNKVATKEDNPILLAAEFHYRYIRIHPFDDGNGRTARILMNFILMQFGYPPVIIKTDDKENYFAVLRQADAGVLEPFVEYIARNLNYSLEIMIKGAKGENIEEPDDLDKEIALLTQRLEGVGQTKKNPKNKEAILKVYDHSVSPLVKLFFNKGEKFEKFYLHNSFLLFIDDTTIQKSKEDIIISGRDSISNDTNLIRIRFSYKTFNKKDFEHFNHESEIGFSFQQDQYYVINTAGEHFEKNYGQPLNDTEIIKLINTEIKKHKALIEKEIERIERQK